MAAAADRGRLPCLTATTCPRACIQPMKQGHAANATWSGLEAAISALLSLCLRIHRGAPGGAGGSRHRARLRLHCTCCCGSIRSTHCSPTHSCSAVSLKTIHSRVRSSHQLRSAASAALLQAGFGPPSGVVVGRQPAGHDVGGPCAAVATGRRSGTGAGRAYPQSCLSSTGFAHSHRPGIGYTGGRRQCPRRCWRMGAGTAAGGDLGCRCPHPAATVSTAAAPPREARNASP